jgi:NADPH:quinone reductase-like Zn-dependent oxidoreductase
MTDLGLGMNEGDYPLPLGIGVSGLVVEIGEGVQRLHKGDRVSSGMGLVECAHRC